MVSIGCLKKWFIHISEELEMYNVNSLRSPWQCDVSQTHRMFKNIVHNLFIIVMS